MAPPRKKRRAPGEGHPVHLRLPTDVFRRIEAKAKDETGWPLNRVIINELAAFPDLEKQAKLGELIRDMEVVLAQYGSRITLAELSEPLLRAVDDVLAAKADGERQARLDKLRVLRTVMLKNERTPKG
jgi:hypothetical protein